MKAQGQACGDWLIVTRSRLCSTSRPDKEASHRRARAHWQWSALSNSTAQHRPQRRRRALGITRTPGHPAGRSSSRRLLFRPADRARGPQSCSRTRGLDVHPPPRVEVQRRAGHNPDNHQPAAEAEVKSAGPCLYALYGTSRFFHPQVPSPADVGRSPAHLHRCTSFT